MEPRRQVEMEEEERRKFGEEGGGEGKGGDGEGADARWDGHAVAAGDASAAQQSDSSSGAVGNGRHSAKEGFRVLDIDPHGGGSRSERGIRKVRGDERRVGTAAWDVQGEEDMGGRKWAWRSEDERRGEEEEEVELEGEEVEVAPWEEQSGGTAAHVLSQQGQPHDARFSLAERREREGGGTWSKGGKREGVRLQHAQRRMQEQYRALRSRRGREGEEGEVSEEEQQRRLGQQLAEQQSQLEVRERKHHT